MKQIVCGCGYGVANSIADLLESEMDLDTGLRLSFDGNEIYSTHPDKNETFSPPSRRYGVLMRSRTCSSRDGLANSNILPNQMGMTKYTS